jgi:hypothetical protein
MWRGSIVLALSMWLAGSPLEGQVKSGKPEAPAVVSREVVRRAAKSGLRSQELRQLSSALKKDGTLAVPVQGALDQGLQGRELAEFVAKEIRNRQDQTAADAAGSASAGGMSGGNGMRSGMGNGMGPMGQRMGPGMGMGGRGSGMGGRGMCGRR